MENTAPNRKHDSTSQIVHDLVMAPSKKRLIRNSFGCGNGAQGERERKRRGVTGSLGFDDVALLGSRYNLNLKQLI